MPGAVGQPQLAPVGADRDAAANPARQQQDRAVGPILDDGRRPSLEHSTLPDLSQDDGFPGLVDHGHTLSPLGWTPAPSRSISHALLRR